MTEDRIKISYDIFRGGFRSNLPPHWDGLEPWMRDAVKVAYLQGMLDRDTKMEHEVRWLGPHFRWCVVRLSDGAKLKAECATREEAAAWAEIKSES